jgi:hypothetical protein
MSPICAVLRLELILRYGSLAPLGVGIARRSTHAVNARADGVRRTVARIGAVTGDPISAR